MKGPFTTCVWSRNGQGAAETKWSLVLRLITLCFDRPLYTNAVVAPKRGPKRCEFLCAKHSGHVWSKTVTEKTAGATANRGYCLAVKPI